MNKPVFSGVSADPSQKIIIENRITWAKSILEKATEKVEMTPATRDEFATRAQFLNQNFRELGSPNGPSLSVYVMSRGDRQELPRVVFRAGARQWALVKLSGRECIDLMESQVSSERRRLWFAQIRLFVDAYERFRSTYQWPRSYLRRSGSKQETLKVIESWIRYLERRVRRWELLQSEIDEAVEAFNATEPKRTYRSFLFVRRSPADRVISPGPNRRYLPRLSFISGNRPERIMTRELPTGKPTGVAQLRYWHIRGHKKGRWAKQLLRREREAQHLIGELVADLDQLEELERYVDYVQT